MKKRARRDGDTAVKKGARRKRRARPLPAWLMKRADLDAMAQRRCILILSVLSGEKPVSDAIEEAQISRQLYYDLESRALSGMLSALTPTSEGPGAPTAQGRIAELEQQVQRLEQEKRRAERLLMLTRQMIKAGGVKTAAGRKRRVDAGSTSAGKKSSARSVKTNAPSPTSTENHSTPTKDGDVGR